MSSSISLQSFRLAMAVEHQAEAGVVRKTGYEVADARFCDVDLGSPLMRSVMLPRHRGR